MASEYNKRGGGYTTDKKDESAKHLDNWTKEEWQTKEGSGYAKQEDGTEKRYLPKKAWEQMSAKEKEETDQKKLEESGKGKQHVSNTSKAKQARKTASKNDQDGKSEPQNCAQHWEDAVQLKEGHEKYKDFKKTDGKTESKEVEEADLSGGGADSDKSASGKTSNPKKRGHGANQKESNKKQKSNSKPKGTAGNKNRVPKKGQKAQWHSLPGYIDGEVVEVVYEKKTVGGKSVKGSKEDPRIVLKSTSGKIAVHKPEAVYFD